MISKQILKEIILTNEEFILKQVNRIVERKEIHLPRSVKKVVVFYGARRSGKTFILYNLFKKHSDQSLYIDFEDERLIEFEVEDFEKLKEAFLELKPQLIGKELIFLLDEVQTIKGWERFCRRMVERENAKIYVSGSSSKVMPFEIHTELRGRVWSTEILPFSFPEYLTVQGIGADRENLFYGRKKALAKKYFLEYMKWGGFPETTLSRSEFEKTKILKEYFSAMFFKDLVERYAIANIILLEALADKLFSSFSLKVSLTSFYKQYKDKFPFSKDLLFRYYKYFLQSMLMFEVRKFAESTYTRMRNPVKIYLADTGLCKRMSSADTGRLLENIAFLELRRRGFEVFYFEEKKECDFIGKSKDGKLSVFQVCFELSEENETRELDGLIMASKWLKQSKSVLLTMDDEKKMRVEGITIEVSPLWKWILSLKEE